MEGDYVPGKTRLCAELSGGLPLSQARADELCDEMERAGRLVFVRSGERTGWHIHTEGEGLGRPA